MNGGELGKEDQVRRPIERPHKHLARPIGDEHILPLKLLSPDGGKVRPKKPNSRSSSEVHELKADWLAGFHSVQMLRVS